MNLNQYLAFLGHWHWNLSANLLSDLVNSAHIQVLVPIYQVLAREMLLPC